MQVAWLPGGRCLATPCTPAPSVLPLTDMATSSYSSSSSESRESEASVSPVQLPPTPPPTSIAIFKSPRESKSSSSKTSHWSSSEESLPAAAFYGPLDAKNPLLVSCDKEIRELLGFIKKKKALATSEEQKHEFHRRCATTLFNIWTKYAPRLPPDYYNEKLLKVGDSLCQIKEYKLALLQCYRRYLQQFGDFDEHKEDVNQFKTVFFPKGFGDETAELTFHVLSSKNICSYKLVCDNDANLQNKESVSQCLHILSSLRLIMQVALPQEHLCWIIFNGTIYIYTICRKLMLIGLSAKALEYLLWASMCMESSAPLLSLRYLTWRATLYTAVCQCHYDCQTSIHGEMVWPRTVTERLLDELFDCTASRFLAVLEALSDSSRRILQTGPLVTDEVELRDVVSELFMAGKELLILSNVGTNGKLDFPKTFFLEHMIERKNIISVCAAVKFTKLAFTYEEWGLFESLAGQLIQFLQKQDIPHLKRAEKDLILLLAVEPLINIKKNKGLIFPLDSDKEGQSVQVYLKHIARHESCVRSCGYSEDIFNLAAILHFCVCVPNKRAPVEQLFYAYELLDKAIAGMNWNFMLTTLSDGSSTIDHCYAKMPTVSTNTKGWEKLKEPKSTQCFTELSVLNKIRKNKLVRASYLMQKALLLFEKNAACVNSQNLLMEAYALIEKLEAEQNALYSYQNYLENSKTKKSRIPPPPILLARTHCSVTLKPAPFISDVKVSWYCILGCKAEGSYGKVRLNNNRLPNSGEAIPADGKSIFEIKGLETNEKYIFAIAAYSSNGKLIGDAVGETTKPILIYPPLSAVTARMYLTQVAYQIGNYELAKKVFSPVWGYFVASPPQDDQSVVSLSNIMMVTQKRMQSNILADTSSILLYLFLRNIFVMSDIKIKEENLFCDNIKGNEIFPAQQMARLRECENVLVALELSNFLNDSNYALQAVTQCYGLLAPIIYHNIVLVPVIQILIKCIVVLQAIPNIVHSKKQVASFESIQHMIACCVFYMAKVLAYRGGYWTLLQNCCRAFWNFAQELQILLKQAVDTYKAFPINQDSFLCACVLPFSLGTELLIDMLIKLQSTNSVKPVEDKGDFSVPSCYGNIKSDNGGSSLIFEHPLDDINVVDLKWIHDYVLKSLEILYQVEKWETLVSLAIQFNTISHERYTEQVTPLLVYAQRQLLTRIQKFNGPDIAQQACARYEADNGQKITCRNFIGKQLMIDPSSPRTLPDAEGCSDLLKMLILSEHQRAKQLVCVPVDVEDTLRCFRETLEKSKYHNRSVRHTKKLLLLFLAQTQGEKGGISNMQFSSGKVEFCLGTEEMHMSTPPDLSQENFRVFSSVEKSKLPYSQLGLVISSFYQTIDVLQDSNQRSLKVQLLHSLGSLFVFAEKKRAAFKCWCQALDDIFRKPDALHTWKEFGTSIPSATNNSSPPVFKDYSEEFLSKLGIWGCLQGAVIAAKIAQFIKTANVKQRTNCCILSALLFQSLLRTTLLHPKAEHSYAQYEITQLLPGIELFTDQFRADICSVIASLYYVIRELHYAKYNLIAEILIDLGFFSEASYEIFQIFHGKNLPSTIPAGYKTIAKVKVLEDLVNKGLPLILVTLGHQHLLNKYNFVKAHFFISLAATINCIPDSSSKTLFYTVAVDKNKPNTPNFKDLYPKDNENVHAQSLRLRDESTLCMMKSLLLTEAEEKINSLLSDMDLQCHKPLCQCSAQELEILVEARLQLAAIALQRQRAPYGAAIVYSTLKLLQDSKIFKKRMPEDLDSPTSPVNSTTENKDDSEFLDPISLNAREYFNIHLWLKCRLMLVTAFIAQIRGIGIMKENDMTDCLSLINEVCMEAKSADDMEILAELLMQAVILGLQEKHLKADIIGNLQLNNELENTVIFSQQEIINLLDGNEFLSPPSWLTLVRSLLLMDDLTKAEKFKDASSKDDKLIFLNQAHSILIAQMLTFGETIKFPLSDADFANPQQPLKNIYLPHVILLAKVKLRIGHTLSKQVYSQNKKKDITKWLPSLHIFEMALKLCKVAALEECEVEAEILFQKGRIERQMLKEDKSPISQPLGKRQSSIKEHASTRFEKFSLLAWIAIRAAAQVSEAVLTINLLIGKKNARTDKVSYMALPNIPEFAIVDLLSSYTDYLLENYQVSFQTGSPFLQQNDEIYDSVDPKRKANNKVDITWILLIRYFIHLQRINNMSKLLASATPVSGISLPDDMLLTSLYNSELILRQKEMHLFLKKFLQFYSSSCIDEFPKELIQGVEKSVSLEKFLFETSGKVHRENSLQSDISGKLFCSPSYTEAFSEMAVQAVNKELCFQWYIPPLDKPPKDTEPMVLLLYAYNLKPLKISDIKVPTANNLVISIHEKLSNLAQIAELSLPSVPEIILEENVYETVEPEDKIVDTDIDNMILDCCSEIVALFSKDQDPTPLYEVRTDWKCAIYRVNVRGELVFNGGELLKPAHGQEVPPLDPEFDMCIS
ncbi:hypothetical protein H671_1g0667 [Cricetulus griseus]|nr:hypothetical protein H671_1g0667 [Cricetulus griseus]